jgi:hypothetical protein
MTTFCFGVYIVNWSMGRRCGVGCGGGGGSSASLFTLGMSFGITFSIPIQLQINASAVSYRVRYFRAPEVFPQMAGKRKDMST